MPDLLPAAPETDALAPRDAALAHAIADAAVRRWLTLSYIIEQAGGRDIRDTEPRMQAALLAGAAQLLLFDRIPDHAAIDETVEWAKHRIRPKAAGMVNAILRRVAEARGEFLDEWDDNPGAIPLSDGGALSLVSLNLPSDPDYRLAVACSLPPALLRAWKDLAPSDADPDAHLRDLALHTLIHPPTICFTAHEDPGSPTPVAADPRFTPHDEPHHAVFIADRAELGPALRDHPGVWVQDPAASRVITDLSPDPQLPAEPLLIDLCAGRGTKTRQLLRAFPSARVIAAEVDDARLAALREAFASDPRVEIAHAETLAGRPPAADLVLTDVPCSNSGVLARRTEARYRVRSDALDRMIQTQRDILRAAAAMLRPGARLVYSTCSLEPEENHRQADWAAANLGLTLERRRLTLPAGRPGSPDTAYRDGSFAAEMRRPA
jgi:16S rRNA (cytosine967-C5)-methyltransferase